MATKRLTMKEYFDIIDSNEYVFEAENIFCKYIPKTLYKFYPVLSDAQKQQQRFEQLKKEQIWLSRKNALNDPFEFEHCVLTSASSDAQNYYKGKTQELEIFCLTECPLNKLMWAHYATAYAGFCVEFSVLSPGNIFPVIYDSELPDLSAYYQRFFENRENLTQHYSSLNNDELSKDILRLNYPLVCKDLCWSYEKEFRIISSSPLDGKRGHLYYAKDFSLFISKIIVGANCTREVVCELRKIVDTINQSRFNRQKNHILQSDNCPVHDGKSMARALWKQVPLWGAELSITKIDWNDKLELVERELMEGDF